MVFKKLNDRGGVNVRGNFKQRKRFHQDTFFHGNWRLTKKQWDKGNLPMQAHNQDFFRAGGFSWN